MNDFDIKAENVHFKYYSDEVDKKGVEVLKGVDLQIGKGEFIAILGHNGSGKSTIAKHFNAILLPCDGKVYVSGIDTSIEDSLFDIRQKVGMVFQNPDNQLVATIVEEDVAFALENLGVPQEEMRMRVDDALKAVNMYDYREHAPSQLSGGQKQRIAIAGIIAMRPQCIVLDEPTAMLDPRGRLEVLRTIRELNREYGITIILITHYMDEAAEADRVIVMNSGKIILDDVPKEVFSHVEELKSVGLDVPQVTELIYELNKYGFELDSKIIYESECVEELVKLFRS